MLTKTQRSRVRQRFRLTVGGSWHRKEPDLKTWEDIERRDLESMLGEIAEEVVLAGERQYREHKDYQYQRLVERKQELEEGERQRIETEARLERERLEQLKQERIQRLLDEAADHRRACDIRDYVDCLLSSVAGAPPQDLEKAHAWVEWAREQPMPLIRLSPASCWSAIDVGRLISSSSQSVSIDPS